MKNTILALQPLLSSQMRILEEEYDIIRLWEFDDPEAVLQKRAFDVQGIVSTYNCSGVGERLMAALPNLEIIAQFGVGYDNIDLKAAENRGVFLTNTPDILTEDVADAALCLLINVARRIVEADMFVRVGRWYSGFMPLSTSIQDKTLGIVGLGRIGTAIARRAQAFNMNVIYHSRTPKKAGSSYKYYKSLENMAVDSDFLLLACSGGESSNNLINYKILQKLGPKGYLINIARGSVVNEEDLLVSLRNRDIAGAALDVFADEPNVPEEMLKMDNVVLTPHIASATLETRSKMGQLVIDNLNAHFSGQELPTPVCLSTQE